MIKSFKVGDVLSVCFKKQNTIKWIILGGTKYVVE